MDFTTILKEPTRTSKIFGQYIEKQYLCIIIKYNANQKYTTDGVSAAKIKELCQEAKVPFQTYVNRSDEPGGATLGNISTAHISVNAADIGLPQLAMHCSVETAGSEDTVYLYKMMKTYFGG